VDARALSNFGDVPVAAANCVRECWKRQTGKTTYVATDAIVIDSNNVAKERLTISFYGYTDGNNSDTNLTFAPRTRYVIARNEIIRVLALTLTL